MLIQFATKRAKPYRKPRVALLNRRGREHLFFKNVCVCKMLCTMLRSALCN